MTVVLTVESAVLLLLVVLVAGLLRSHADILRALHDLGVDLGGDEPRATPVPLGGVASPASGDAASGRTAPDLAGATPLGDAAVVAVRGAGGATEATDTLIAFLSSGCGACTSFWQQFAGGAHHHLDGARTVVVTRDLAEESPAALRGMAPADLPVVMSSAAWDDYHVPGSPYFVYVDGETGTVAGEGTAARWEQLVSLCAQARSDGAGRGRRAPWSTDAAREARADRDLLAAGIHPGHPSLYPSSERPS